MHILSSDDYIVGTHFVSNEVALLGNHADDKSNKVIHSDVTKTKAFGLLPIYSFQIKL